LSDFLLQLLTTAHGTFAYTLVFGILVACGVGLPLPEDVALVIGGYLSFKGASNLWLMLAFALLGILAGDLLVYAAGRRYGQDLAQTRWLHRYLTDEKRQRVEGYFAKYGERLVVGARFLPGLRVVTYFSAGASEMGAGRFLLFDALAACVSAPLWIFIGRRLGKRINQALVWVSRFHWALMGLAAVLFVVILIFVLRRNGAAAAVKREVVLGKSAPPPPQTEQTRSAG
jgi:membrane protein DedA with SNARE-associated domain